MGGPDTRDDTSTFVITPRIDVEQPAPKASHWKRMRKRQRVTLISALGIFLCAGILLASILLRVALPVVQRKLAVATPVVTNGSDAWANAHMTTAATYPFSAPANPVLSVNPAFQTYYATHGGAVQLGTPLTIAFPTQQGMVQFFENGALLLPTSLAAATAPSAATPKTIPAQSIKDGVVDSATGIVRLSFVGALITNGSEALVDDADSDSNFTYADLRRAALPNAMTTEATANATATATSGQEAEQGVFVPEGHLSGKVIGHTIPAAIWSYITEPATSLEGWQADFGLPLTEAVPLTVTQNGKVDHLRIQAFQHAALLVDDDHLTATGQPTIRQVDTGLAYLKTMGPPAPALAAHQQIWALGSVAVLAAPVTGAAQIHVGQNFTFTSDGASQWTQNALWYAVQWKTPGSSGMGWVAATQVTLTAPTAGSPAWASFDALSPTLSTYLTSQGVNVGAVVYDVTRGQYYIYNQNAQFIMASSSKVPIMLTTLKMADDQHRGLTSNEMYLLTTMIENSNNDSAQALFDEIGGAPGLANFMSYAGVSGMIPNPDGWGYSTISPLAMAQLLTKLHQGTILTAQDRALALNLMTHIEPDQQMGVGVSAPAGATVAMKDGWVIAPDGLWAANTSGIVTVGQEVYIITVYTQDHTDLDDAWNITQHVCGTVGQLLA